MYIYIKQYQRCFNSMGVSVGMCYRKMKGRKPAQSKAIENI